LSFGVRLLCGSPPDEPLEGGGLPEALIYETLNDAESQMLIDLDLSDQNRRVAKKVFSNLASDSFAVNASDFSAPSFAQLKVSPEDNWYEPVEIVNRASIDQAGSDGRLAISFYGTPPSIQLSWLPQDSPGQQLVVWYDKTIPADGSQADSPPMDDAYTTHLKLQAAAQCMELMGKEVGKVLQMRIAKGEAQWRRSATMSRQQGLVDKRSSHPRAGRYRSSFRASGGAIIR
jgi:hypothetical protein